MKYYGIKKRFCRMFFLNIFLAIFILSACGKSDRKVENNNEVAESGEIIYSDEDVVVSNLRLQK